MLRIIAIKETFQKYFSKGSHNHSCPCMVHGHCTQSDMFQSINASIYIYKVLCNLSSMTWFDYNHCRISIAQFHKADSNISLPSHQMGAYRNVDSRPGDALWPIKDHIYGQQVSHFPDRELASQPLFRSPYFCWTRKNERPGWLYFVE